MDTPLGRPTRYTDRYDPSLLAPVPRAPLREGLGIRGELPFIGEDVWNGYEFSWLTSSGLPRVAALRFRVDARSPRLVESKSVKLYLNGFAQTAFESTEAVAAVLTSDLTAAVDAPVSVHVAPLDAMDRPVIEPPGDCLDVLDVAVDRYLRAPELLETTGRTGR